jgi:hypothetical protein
MKTEYKHIIVDKGTYDSIKKLAGDIPITRYIKRLVERECVKNDHKE